MSCLRPPTQHELENRFGGRYKWMVLFTIAFGSIASVLSTTSFNVAIPTLMREFGLGQDKIQWAITGFMAAMTVSMLPTPWLLDRFGFRRCFIGTILLLGAASVAGSLATHFSFLVVTRILQGTAAGLLQPFGILAIMRLFPPGIQGRATGILSFSIVLAPAVAPTLGGLLLDTFGWEAIFLINLPMCTIACVAAMFLMPKAENLQSRSFDWFGVALLGIGTLCSVECVASLHDNGLFAWRTIFFTVLAGAAYGIFAWHARHAVNPIITLDLFQNRAFSMGALVSLAYGFGLYASTYLIPVFLQSVLGFSATAAGLALLPAGLTLAFLLPIAGHTADKLPPRLISMVGLGLFCLSFVLFAVMGIRITYVEIIGFALLGRIGLAMILPSLTLASLRSMTHEQLAPSSMVVSYSRQLGGVFGVAVSAVFLEWRILAHGSSPDGISSAYSQVFMLLACAFALALIAASQMKNKTTR